MNMKIVRLNFPPSLRSLGVIQNSHFTSVNNITVQNNFTSVTRFINFFVIGHDCAGDMFGKKSQLDSLERDFFM